MKNTRNVIAAAFWLLIVAGGAIALDFITSDMVAAVRSKLISKK